MACFNMLVGLPASGKSTIGKNIYKKAPHEYISSDEYREKMFGDINNQEHNNEVFQAMFDNTILALRNHKDVVYDACNINYKKRKCLVNEILRLVPNTQMECTVVLAPYETCLERNNQRERKIPESVITNMYLNFYVPAYYEGWNVISIEYNCSLENITYNNLVKKLDIQQDNTHHNLSLTAHLLSAMMNVEGDILKEAALLHDIGKPFTKTFVNNKGETTEEAHYYNHQNVGAYDSLFYTNSYTDYQSLYIANLIQWHMQPFFMDTEKAKKKFKELIGDMMYDDIMELHEADLKAH